jgi:hypothetical protein
MQIIRDSGFRFSPLEDLNQPPRFRLSHGSALRDHDQIALPAFVVLVMDVKFRPAAYILAINRVAYQAINYNRDRFIHLVSDNTSSEGARGPDFHRHLPPIFSLWIVFNLAILRLT